MRPVVVLAVVVSSALVALLFAGTIAVGGCVTFSPEGPAPSVVHDARPGASTGVATDGSTNAANGGWPPESPMAFAVRQRAATDFHCDENKVALKKGERRGSVRPGHSRESFVATGCGQSAEYVAVCALDEDGSKACDAVAAEGNARQMSPFGE